MTGTRSEVGDSLSVVLSSFLSPAVFLSADYLPKSVSLLLDTKPLPPAAVHDGLPLTMFLSQVPGDLLELSFRWWCCGGEVVYLPCTKVGTDRIMKN